MRRKTASLGCQLGGDEIVQREDRSGNRVNVRRFPVNCVSHDVARTPLKDHVGQVANLRRVANPPSGSQRTSARQVYQTNPCLPGGQNTLVSAPHGSSIFHAELE